MPSGRHESTFRTHPRSPAWSAHFVLEDVPKRCSEVRLVLAERLAPGMTGALRRHFSTERESVREVSCSRRAAAVQPPRSRSAAAAQPPRKNCATAVQKLCDCRATATRHVTGRQVGDLFISLGDPDVETREEEGWRPLLMSSAAEGPASGKATAEAEPTAKLRLRVHVSTIVDRPLEVCPPLRDQHATQHVPAPCQRRAPAVQPPCARPAGLRTPARAAHRVSRRGARPPRVDGGRPAGGGERGGGGGGASRSPPGPPLGPSRGRHTLPPRAPRRAHR